MVSCDFCKIIQGELDVHNVYEDEFTLAFLDKHPIRPGHTLVIPKVHVPDFQELEPFAYRELFDVVKKLSQVIAREFRPKKVGLVVAGFDVPHTHIHIVPMEEFHDITSQAYQGDVRPNATDGELEQYADRITCAIES